jgi:hypothetical protein
MPLPTLFRPRPLARPDESFDLFDRMMQRMFEGMPLESAGDGYPVDIREEDDHGDRSPGRRRRILHGERSHDDRPRKDTFRGRPAASRPLLLGRPVGASPGHTAFLLRRILAALGLSAAVDRSAEPPSQSPVGPADRGPLGADGLGDDRLGGRTSAVQPRRSSASSRRSASRTAQASASLL